MFPFFKLGLEIFCEFPHRSLRGADTCSNAPWNQDIFTCVHFSKLLCHSPIALFMHFCLFSLRIVGKKCWRNVLFSIIGETLEPKCKVHFTNVFFTLHRQTPLFGGEFFHPSSKGCENVFNVAGGTKRRGKVLPKKW